MRYDFAVHPRHEIVAIWMAGHDERKGKKAKDGCQHFEWQRGGLEEVFRVAWCRGRWIHGHRYFNSGIQAGAYAEIDVATDPGCDRFHRNTFLKNNRRWGNAPHGIQQLSFICSIIKSRTLDIWKSQTPELSKSRDPELPTYRNPEITKSQHLPILKSRKSESLESRNLEFPKSRNTEIQTLRNKKYHMFQSSRTILAIAVFCSCCFLLLLFLWGRG